MRPARVLPAVLLLAALVLAACRTEEATPAGLMPPPREYAGPPRSFLMGFSATPHELTNEAYRETYDRAARYGEVLLVQRPPAWEAFFDASSVPSEVRERTLAERNATEARGLRLVVVLDVFDPIARERLQGVPDSHRGRGLDDEDLRKALVNEAVFIARNQQPVLLVIGNEINATYERHPTAFANFLVAYSAAYEAVKQVAPDVQVTASFQYEELLGVVPWQPPHAARWELLGSLTGQMDVFAITTYPSFTYQVARKIPPLYYRQIRDHTDIPVAFLSVGFSSGAVRQGLNSSTEPEQRRFLQLRLLEDADWLGARFVIWLVSRDLLFASDPPLDLLAKIGLQDTDGEPKEAWTAWEEASRRPYDPEAAERARVAAREDATPEAEPGTGSDAELDGDAEATPTAAGE